jgi:hypothetical protein
VDNRGGLVAVAAVMVASMMANALPAFADPPYAGCGGLFNAFEDIFAAQGPGGPAMKASIRADAACSSK